MTNNRRAKIKQISRNVFFFAVCMLIGVGFGFLMVQKLPDDISTPLMIVNDIGGVLLIFLAFFLQIIWHELGHMIAALLRGWNFLSFMILSFMISKRNGKLHFSRLKIMGAGGQCLMMPPKEGDTDFGIAFYNAGGILMNAITGILALLVLISCWEALGFISAVLLYGLTLAGFVFALINGIPMNANGLANDGQNMVSLRKDPFSTTIILEGMRILGGLQQGKTLKEVMPHYFCEDQEIDYSNSIHAMACSFDLSLAISQMDFEKAHAIARQLDAHKFEIVGVYQQEISLEEVYLNLVAPVSGVSVERYLTESLGKYMDQQASFRPSALRVKYAIAHLKDHDEAQAEKYYQQFLRACDRYHVVGEVVTEKKLVEYARQMRSDE